MCIAYPAIEVAFSWLPYSTYVYLDFHLSSRLLFQAGMNVLNQYACHLSKEELEAKNWHMGVENIWKKTTFSQHFFSWASTKSKIPEMGQPKSGIPEIGQLKTGIPEMGQPWNPELG